MVSHFVESTNIINFGDIIIHGIYVIQHDVLKFPQVCAFPPLRYL